MGYYIEGPARGKVEFITKNYGAQMIRQPADLSQIPAGKALIVVIDNGMFQAAGYAYYEGELKAFTRPDDLRPKVFLLIDKSRAEELTGYIKP